MEFVALDFETANADISSICQIGLVHFKDGTLQEEWKAYVDPEDFFDEINISIHGIDENTVKGAPNLRDISSRICSYLDNRIAICHTHFDRVALHKACEKYSLRMPTCTWLDSARITRRTWDQCAYKGYGLGNVCAILGYQFVQHDALEDAKAAAHVLLAAIEKTGIDLQGWLKRVKQPIDPSVSNISREGNPDGFLYGEVLVFTGTLEVTRREAADMVANTGCAVATGVTKNTTIVVVGDVDARKLAPGQVKYAKHRKAEKLIAQGYPIKIYRESDFKALILAENE
ncbi:MAG: exonuclease domain-containing protein [Smithellaceae bacterium]|nr:exonuclease domain-containing protein [Smithellaceae bacterium]